MERELRRRLGVNGVVQPAGLAAGALVWQGPLVAPRLSGQSCTHTTAFMIDQERKGTKE